MNRMSDSLTNGLAQLTDRLLAHLPVWLEALVLLMLGWLLAHLVRGGLRRTGPLVDRLLQRSAQRPQWRGAQVAEVLGTAAFWAVLIFFVTAATQALGLSTFSDWLARLLDHLPTVVAGLLIITAGFLLSGFAAGLVNVTATALAPAQRTALARVVRSAILVLALLVGADQIGLHVTWLAIFAAVLLATVLGGAALAVGLGARAYVANLIGAHHLGQALRLGERVRVAGHEGRVVGITATSVLLETPEGRVVLPGQVYNNEAVVVFSAQGPDAASGHTPEVGDGR